MRVNREISSQRLAHFLQTADEATLNLMLTVMEERSREEEEIRACLAPRIAAAERGEGEWLADDAFWRRAEDDMDRMDAAPDTAIPTA